MGVVMWGQAQEQAQEQGQERGQGSVRGCGQEPGRGPGSARAWGSRRWTRMRTGTRDAGMATSEYAMGLIAAVGFAGLLYKVVTSGPVRAGLQAVVERALHVQF
ncbi:hypothetical protein GCM10010245_33560 [Streptomyces spectabilis]|nr:hypothetical protein GCM10010245_33560 [Streptomyces spectabilis]